MKIKGDDIMEKEFNALYGLGIKDYELSYLQLIKRKMINKRHWENSYNTS